MNMKSQFSVCENCKFNTKCCKIVPPMIFEFEKSKFKNSITFEDYKNHQVPFLKKNKFHCTFLKNKQCQIFNKRPFNCRMFPFDIKKINNKLYWILWQFCYVPKKIEQNLQNFEKILPKISKKELNLYLDYTSSCKDFKNLKFRVLREVKAHRVKILQYRNHRFMFLDDYLWMWDTPQERKLQEELAKKAFGDVLVAGYGFGILARFLLKNPKVKFVTTVEKFKEVIEKMKEFGPIHGKIIIGDFYDLPEDKKFDCIIGDIWPDIDPKFLKDYIKFKKKAKKLLKNNGKILAWGKDFFEYLLKTKIDERL